MKARPMSIETRIYLREVRAQRAARKRAVRNRAVLEEQVAAFNAVNQIGTPVRYWTGARRGPGEEGCTRTAAWVAGGHTTVVMVTGHPAWIALSHVEVISSAGVPA